MGQTLLVQSWNDYKRSFNYPWSNRPYRLLITSFRPMHENEVIGYAEDVNIQDGGGFGEFARAAAFLSFKRMESDDFTRVSTQS